MTLFWMGLFFFLLTPVTVVPLTFVEHVVGTTDNFCRVVGHVDTLYRHDGQQTEKEPRQHRFETQPE